MEFSVFNIPALFFHSCRGHFLFTLIIHQLEKEFKAVFNSIGDTYDSDTTNFLQVADMLMELYITDLEDIAASAESTNNVPKPITVESTHPYADESFTNGRVKIPGKCYHTHTIIMSSGTDTCCSIDTISAVSKPIIYSQCGRPHFRHYCMYVVS